MIYLAYDYNLNEINCHDYVNVQNHIAYQNDEAKDNGGIEKGL